MEIEQYSISNIYADFGMLWKLIMLFSSTWRMLESDVFQNDNGKVLDFVWEHSTMS